MYTINWLFNILYQVVNTIIVTSVGINSFSPPKNLIIKKCSAQFSCLVMSDSLQPRGLQHARLPCLSPTPRVYSNSYPLRRRQWQPSPVLLPGKSPWMEEPGGLQSTGSHRVGHDWATSLSLSYIGEGNGNPLRCSCLETPRDGGAWWAAYGVAQSWTWLKRLSSSSSSVSIESVMPSNHLVLCRPILFLPSIPPSIRVFSNESALRVRWPKCWSFSFSLNPSSEYSGLVSFRVDWLDLLAVQGTLKSLVQHHSSKASILWCSALFIVQLSHPYMTIGKIIALTRWTFVGKVMSLLFNMLSRLVISFLPRSKHLLISWLQSPSAVFLEPPKI